MFYLQIFRIQDPESSGSKDPAGKSQEGQGFCQLKVLNMAKSLPRKVKGGFSFALGSQPFEENE